MSAINGDKARFNRQRKQKLAKRERYRLLREKLTAPAKRPSGRDLCLLPFAFGLGVSHCSDSGRQVGFSGK
jgi:hypothetical protein